MRTRTLAELRADARIRADMVGSTLLSDLAVNELVNQSIAKVYRALVATRGHGYYVNTYQFVTADSKSQYPLPQDFWELQAADANMGGQRVQLKSFEPKERAQWSTQSVPAGTTVTLTYVPTPSRLSTDAEFWDGICGYEEAVILDAAIKMLQIEESDPSILAAQLADEMRNIALMAGDRDASTTGHIVDVRRRRRGLGGVPMGYGQLSTFVPRYRLQGNTIELLWGPGGLP